MTSYLSWLYDELPLLIIWRVTSLDYMTSTSLDYMTSYLSWLYDELPLLITWRVTYPWPWDARSTCPCRCLRWPCTCRARRRPCCCFWSPGCVCSCPSCTRTCRSGGTRSSCRRAASPPSAWTRPAGGWPSCRRTWPALPRPPRGSATGPQYTPGLRGTGSKC